MDTLCITGGVVDAPSTDPKASKLALLVSAAELVGKIGNIVQMLYQFNSANVVWHA